MEISKTDLQKIIKYLEDDAKVYDTMPGLRNSCNAWTRRAIVAKLQRKLTKFNNPQIQQL